MSDLKEQNMGGLHKVFARYLKLDGSHFVS